MRYTFLKRIKCIGSCEKFRNDFDKHQPHFYPIYMSDNVMVNGRTFNAYVSVACRLDSLIWSDWYDTQTADTASHSVYYHDIFKNSLHTTKKIL